MLSCVFVDAVVFQLSFEEVVPYFLRGKAPASIIEADVEYDVGDGVWRVDHGDVVNGFRCGKSQETDNSCIWFEAREV